MGAVRNRQLYILLMYCKGCISFNFSIFLYNLYNLPQKKITCPYRNKSVNFFSNSHDLPQKKLHAFKAKKITRLDAFLYTTYIFHPKALLVIAPSLRRYTCWWVRNGLTTGCVPDPHGDLAA